MWILALVVSLAVTTGRAGDEHHEHDEHEAQHGHHDEESLRVAPDVAKRSGIEVDTAGPGKIERRLRLYGRIGPDEDRLAHVVSRFPGVVRELRHGLGDVVTAGATLAVVESNESLRRFEVTSPIAGTIVAKNVTVGEATGTEAIYVVADLRRVWLDLAVPSSDFGELAVGQRVDVSIGGETIPARIDYLSPLGTPATQSLLARSFVPNPLGRVRPGLFATADVLVEEADVLVAVNVDAVQTREGRSVIFRVADDTYEAQPVELGRSDGRRIEIRSGLEAGDRYVARGSFVLKAELGKGEATHDH